MRTGTGTLSLAAVLLVCLAGGSAAAQTRGRTAARRPAPPPRKIEVHGFVDVGATRFTANQSFAAIFGSATGTVFGGGGGVVLPLNVFVDVRGSRFEKTGHRVFVSNGERFDLGINDTVTITPIELTGGYRFGRTRVIPYAGGGISWYRYQETDPFAAAGESPDQRFTGFHMLGGAEGRVLRWLGVAGEVEWARVADALGANPNSVSAAYGEHDLGGTTVRLKVVVGR
jgi:hypothetical protein